MRTDPILVTGAAGFIGFHTAQRLLDRGEQVVGIDNLNDYYEVSLKQSRLEQLQPHGNFAFEKVDISDRTAMEQLWATRGPFKRVIHLAAQAGVRYSLKEPYQYIKSNSLGHLTVLEMCRHTEGFQHLAYASSSSVYGGNQKKPFAVEDPVNDPLSLYAATKRSAELMSQSYSHLYNIPQTGLRFFTVYGPWGRPDMALFIFTRAILSGQPVQLFNKGKMRRDFTYIDDIVSGVVKTLDTPPGGGSHRVLNIGNNRSEDLMDFIRIIEEKLGVKADIELLEMQAGDVHETYADIDETTRITGYKPTTSIQDGIPRFVDWYKQYYQSAGNA